MGTDSKAKIIGNKEDLECKSYLETINFKTKTKNEMREVYIRKNTSIRKGKLSYYPINRKHRHGN